MNKSTKGALAATAAGFLLLGGAGSLAFWSDTDAVGGATINAGDLALGSPNCGAGWTLDSAGGGGTYGTTSKVVPGDVLTKTCTYVITAKGDHLRATVTAAAPSLSNSFNGNLTATVTDIKVNGAPATSFTSADNGKNLTVTVAVTFNGADTASQNLSSVLDDITVTATQVHS